MPHTHQTDPDFTKAQLWRPEKDKAARCHLCSHSCMLVPGAKGRCGARMNQNGEMLSLVGNHLISLAVDPIEKKPLYHYLPGSRTFSMGSMGCNFSCSFCQNADISHAPIGTGSVWGRPCSPREICLSAEQNACPSIAFTYNEPTVFYEFLTATAQQAQDRGLGTVLVSNGYQSREALKRLRPCIQAANIDLKAFSDDFYRRYCGARLAPVLDNLKQMVDMGWWLEVTTLFIPGLNDSPEEMHGMARFIRESLGAGIPWHCTAFHPCHEMKDRAPTPASTLLRACKAGQEAGLLFVYPGNTAFSQPTCCPACGAVVIGRQGWRTALPAGFAGACTACGAILPGIWQKHHGSV